MDEGAQAMRKKVTLATGLPSCVVIFIVLGLYGDIDCRLVLLNFSHKVQMAGSAAAPFGVGQRHHSRLALPQTRRAGAG